MQASNAYLQVLQGPGTQMLFEFIKEVPTIIRLDSRVQGVLDFLLRIASFGLLIYPVTVSIKTMLPTNEKALQIVIGDIFSAFTFISSNSTYKT